MTSRLIKSRLPCPSCTSSDAYHEYDDGHGYCFSCNTYFPSKDANNLSNFTYEYMPWRGITKESMRLYDVKTKIDAEGKPISIGFRYPNGSYKVRYLENKDFYWLKGDGVPDSQPGLFGKDKFSPGAHRYVTITEGEPDALSLWQVLQSPVVSVQSSSSAARDCTVDRSFLNSYERIYLAFDGDAPGREAAARVARLFDYNKVWHVKFQGSRKDANDYLQAGEANELRQLWWNAKKFLPETIISGFDDFEKILKEVSKPGVPYPFPTLTKMTYGIRTGEMVLITAQEKVGKTSLMHAIEHKLLKETDDAVGAIFLEEPKKRHLQALAGLELKKPVHLPDCDCSETEVLAALKKVVATDDRLHVYSHFGSDDPDVLLDTIRFLVSARGCRYVLLDHITMAVSGLQGDDERRALDYLSTRLEMMVKELDFALIVVSHVNDEGKTRGSRYLTKVSDITIALRRDTIASDAKERNSMYLTIPYNRFCCMSGPAGRIVFDPETYTLSEDLNYANDNFETPAAGFESRVA